MSEPTKADGAEQLRRDIEHTRADLRDTVDELSTRLDVKARAKRRLHDAKVSVADAATRLKQGSPEPVRRALDRVGPAVESTRERAREHRGEVVAGMGAAVLLLLLVIVSRRRRGS